LEEKVKTDLEEKVPLEIGIDLKTGTESHIYRDADKSNQTWREGFAHRIELPVCSVEVMIL
jgi:hypothetical protein